MTNEDQVKVTEMRQTWSTEWDTYSAPCKDKFQAQSTSNLHIELNPDDTSHSLSNLGDVWIIGIFLWL